MNGIQVGSMILMCFSLLSCKDIQKDETLIHRSLEYAQAKYGLLGTPREINLNSSTVVKLYEYQNELVQHCPEIKNGDTVLIREYVKDISKKKRIVIWMKQQDSQWIIFDNLIYNPQKIKF